MIKSVKTALVLLLLSAAQSGLAQNPPAPPPCYYGINGYPVGTPKWQSTTKFTHLVWFCGDRKHENVYIAGFSCRAGYCRDAVFGAAMLAITRATAKVRTADEQWTANVTINCSEPQPVALDQEMCDDRKAWIESRKPIWRQEVQYWLEPN